MAEKTNIERTLETLVDLVDLARKQSVTSFDKVNASIDTLAVNVGQLAVMQRATTQSIDRLIIAVERQNNAIDGHLRLSEAQSVNIAELTRLATKLIDKAA